MLRNIKVLLVLSVGLFGLIGALGNLLDWNGTYGAVAATTSMSTWDGGAASWKATSHPLIVYPGAILIVLLKIAFGALCVTGAWNMSRARKLGEQAFEAAKTLALAGCGLAIFMLFAGWVVIGAAWFELWRSDAPRGSALGTAFIYAGFIGLIALFVALRDDREVA